MLRMDRCAWRSYIHGFLLQALGDGVVVAPRHTLKHLICAGCWMPVTLLPSIRTLLCGVLFAQLLQVCLGCGAVASVSCVLCSHTDAQSLLLGCFLLLWLCLFLVLWSRRIFVSQQKAVEGGVVKGVDSFSLALEALRGRVACALGGAATQLDALALGHAAQAAAVNNCMRDER